MRTTIEIEDDVLAAAKELARREGSTAGRVISALVRKALTGTATPAAGKGKATHGFRPFPSRGGVVSNEVVDRLRDVEGV